jgi:catechol 2,3-dioxygenase-like lactoylglutathione lyase family enzyme
MLTNARLMAFISVRDLSRARSFYGTTLGLEITDENPFALTVNANGTRLLLTEVSDLRPQSFTIAGWEIPDIDATIDALVSSGITFLRYDGFDQDDKGIWKTPGGDLVAWFADPDGNMLSLTTFHHPTEG